MCSAGRRHQFRSHPVRSGALANSWFRSAAMSPAALAMLAAFPTPTSSGTCALGATVTGCLDNFVGAGAGPYNQNSFDTRVDFTASQSLNIFGRFSLNHFTLSGAPSLGAVGGVGFGPGGLAGSSNVHNYSLAAGRDEDDQLLLCSPTSGSGSFNTTRRRTSRTPASLR